MDWRGKYDIRFVEFKVTDLEARFCSASRKRDSIISSESYAPTSTVDVCISSGTSTAAGSNDGVGEWFSFRLFGDTVLSCVCTAIPDGSTAALLRLVATITRKRKSSDQIIKVIYLGFSSNILGQPPGQKSKHVTRKDENTPSEALSYVMDFVRYYLQFPPVTRTYLTGVFLVSVGLEFNFISRYTLYRSILGSTLRFFDGGWGIWFIVTLAMRTSRMRQC
jgi:hypothetical protein